jgi:hypothetical protein
MTMKLTMHENLTKSTYFIYIKKNISSINNLKNSLLLLTKYTYSLQNSCAVFNIQILRLFKMLGWFTRGFQYSNITAFKNIRLMVADVIICWFHKNVVQNWLLLQSIKIQSWQQTQSKSNSSHDIWPVELIITWQINRHFGGLFKSSSQQKLECLSSKINDPAEKIWLFCWFAELESIATERVLWQYCVALITYSNSFSRHLIVIQIKIFKQII